ncbi:MAG TPA: HDIG domain-containing protein [Thermoguttaceae bacterium]|nr:HDIG domain-containing protein [Thermoguttaceae bacterium]
MTTGGQKRTRSQRVAALELPPGVWKRLGASLRRNDVLLRIGLCVAAALVLCVVIRGWHPPFVYRKDYTPSQDLVARVPFEVSISDAEVTRATVEPAIVEYEAGQTLAEAGQPLRKEQVRALRAEHEAWIARRSAVQMLARALAVVTIILGLLALCGLYLSTRERRLIANIRPLGLVLALAVATVAVAYWMARDSWRAEILPLILFGQTVAIAYRRQLALLFAGVATAILVMGLGQGLGSALVLMGVTTTAILPLGRIRNRSKLIYVGAFAGLAAFLLSIAVAIIDNQSINPALLKAAGVTALCTLGAGILMTSLLFFIERLFGVLTDMSLLELGDVSHPLLQQLVNRAPGTYNHSIIVGSIAEAAADAIGAWGLLVRVGAYFHDIGKMLKPVYFIENQPPGDNCHDGLVPAMSTLVIVAHVKDGADLARQHKLPDAIVQLIEQHHGTTLVEYFFDRANEQSRSDPNGNGVEESTFRYPGPKPQTREAGVLMLADAAESACRSLVDPAPARIESVVREVTDRKLQDGQFDESGLSLPQLRTVEQSIVKSLVANYHGRIKYPDQRTA